MSKYCQNCGTQMDDNAMFCSNCGFKVVNVAENQQEIQQQEQLQYQQVQQVENEQSIQQVQEVNYNQGYYQQQNANPIPKKKSKKKPIIISVIAVVLVAVLAFGGFTLYGKFFGDKVNSGKFVFEEDGKTIYFGYQPMVLDGDSISKIDVLDKSGEQTEIPTLKNPFHSTSDGDTIYYVDSKEPYLKKLTYNDGKMYTDTWVESGLLNSNENVSSDKHYIYNISNLKYSNDYIYFNTVCYETIMNDSLERAYRIGRISKDGKSIEMLSDQIHASDYTISDGWIYYFDNGFNYSSDIDYNESEYSMDDDGNLNRSIPSESFSPDRVGLYRAKLDGSNIEKLYGNFDKEDAETSSLEYWLNEVCTDMTVVDNYIYFIDYSKNGQGKVCRINKDGSDYQVISENYAQHYTIEGDTLYYVLGQSSIVGETNDKYAGEIYEKKIDDTGSDKELMKCIGSENWVQYFDNCLYVSTLKFSLSNVGQRYDFEKDKMEVIHGVEEGREVEMNEETGVYAYKEGKKSYEWKDNFTENH